MDDWNLREFLVSLNELNKANIDFIDNKYFKFYIGSKYKKELMQVQDLINSFELNYMIDEIE